MWQTLFTYILSWLLKVSRTLKHSKIYKAYQIVGSNENWNISSQFINQADSWNIN